MPQVWNAFQQSDRVVVSRRSLVLEKLPVNRMRGMHSRHFGKSFSRSLQIRRAAFSELTSKIAVSSSATEPTTASS